MERRHEVLFNQAKLYREQLVGLITNTTEEQADFVPPKFTNNIRWNLGHVYLDQFLWIQHLTKEPISLVPDGFKQWFDYGTSPSTWTSKPPSLDTLRGLLIAQPKQIEVFYSDRLEEAFPATEAGMYTIAQVLVRTLFHEGIHMQAIMDIRKFL